MNRGGKGLAAAATLAVVGCAGNSGILNIRPMASALAQGDKPVSFRVAEARGQFALGNIALALESFRKAQREDPNSIDAAIGLADCYVRMGRFDLSSRYYQSALAIDPRNPEALTALADSLELQGRAKEAASVRQELAGDGAEAPLAVPSIVSPAAPAALVAAVEAPVPLRETPAVPDQLAGNPAAIPLAPEPVVVEHRTAASVTIRLPEIAPIPQAAAPVRQVAADEHRAVASASARLERTSLGEVALITTGGPAWKTETVSRNRVSTTVRFVPLQSQVQRVAAVRLLNAARVNRLAARTRTLLAEVGWTRMTIGDAPSVRRRSLILYPANHRAPAERLAAKFGFPAAPGKGIDRVTIYLGRDAVPLVSKRA